MIDIIRNKLPKEYERVVLEEYYKFLMAMYGANGFGKNNLKFTRDKSKLSRRELSDQLFLGALGILDSVETDDNIELIVNKEDDGRISALSRLRVLDGNEIHIAEVLFLEYQTEEEQMAIMNEMFAKIEEYAQALDCSTLYYEVPKFAAFLIQFSLNKGFVPIEEPKKVTSVNRTYVFQKAIDLKRGECGGSTLSRKQSEK